MRGNTSWSYAPYCPPLWQTGDIYICRLYPGEKKIGVDWLPTEGEGDYTLSIRKRGERANWVSYTTRETSFVVAGLEDSTDYELFVKRGEKKSRVRLARTGFVPGDSVVNYLHPEDDCYAFSGQYLCSPSLVRHPEGYLLASMDVFKGNSPQDLSLIFRSDDEGATWRYQCELFPCFWGKLFIHRGEVYMLSCSTEYGDLLIGKSTDGGKSFGVPTVLLRGSSGFRQAGVHKNPQKVMIYAGRLWMTLEWGSWAGGGHAAMCGSVPEEADLLEARNWSFTEPAPYDPSWPGAAKGNSAGCLEGTLVVDPEGRLLNVLRYQMDHCVPSFGLACAMQVNPEKPEQALTFHKMLPFPGNHSKFEIHFDPVTGCYLSMVSYLTQEHPSGRNWLALIASRNLTDWEKLCDLYDYRDTPVNEIGFQYVNFLLEGEDLLYLTRTAFNKAANFHDANYSVFSRLPNWRTLLPESLKK